MKMIIVGPQGSGKTLLAVYLARKVAEIDDSVLVYSNMYSHDGFIRTVKDLADIPFNRDPKILIIDEAMFTIDSRSHSSKNNKVWTRAQAFYRKSNFLIVIYVTHSLDLIDNRMRQQLDYVIMARKNKTKFDYLTFDMLTQNTKPFYLPKTQQIFNYANYDTYDFPPPITVDRLQEDILFSIQK